VNHSIAKLRIGIFLIACATLLLELSLVRVFDVILTPNMGYAVITAAVFALGLGGIYLYLFPVEDEDRVLGIMPWLFLAFAVCVLLLRPVINLLPFNLTASGSLGVQVFGWLGMYVTLVAPFFLSGIIISLMLSHYSSQVHSLYFFDLIGAGLGCLLLIPLITPYGPGGIQLVVGAMALVGAMVFSRKRIGIAALAVVAVACVIYPATRDGYLEYRGHANKRGVDDWTAQGLRDFVSWDPVSKVEVFRSNETAHYFALDGGQQGSWMQKSDGDFSVFEDEIASNPNGYYFGMNSVVHYLASGSNPEVLVIGAAVGGETRAAILFGATHIDAIELVGEMVNAATTRYADYSGNLFNHPSVNYRVGEGRTFLRSSDKKYDIIQMFSNHTSSSMADGSAAAPAAYLQTMEAYTEYFTHLAEDGVMQINHHIYPRMLTTAAQAWRELGKTDFSRHVLVAERWIPDTLPVVLISMQPWTAVDVGRVMEYLNREQSPYLYNPPPDLSPSNLVFSGNPYREELSPPWYEFDQVRLWLGTYNQQQLPFDVLATLSTVDGNILGERLIPGAELRDNGSFVLPLERPYSGKGGDVLELSVSAEGAAAENGFIIWSDATGAPWADFRGEASSFVLAFDPTGSASNLIPADFLNKPFPEDGVPVAEYNLSPVTDNNPYFSMIRRTFGPVSPVSSPYMDGGTAWLMNVQVGRMVPSEWLNLFIVGGVSIVFSAIFIFIPLFFSRHGRANWPRMGSYLAYFSCLGAGFILVELVLVQLFKKLIGYPIHTFAAVIFALLISAGAGSLMTKALRVDSGNRWRWVFCGIVAYGAVLTISAGSIFHVFLAYPMTGRIAVAVILLLPLGFMMGMPLPMAVARLGQVEPLGIPWAWGMNGFFTVFGGFLSVVLAVIFGFQVVLASGFLIYLLAMLMYGRIRAPEV
jgi:spermidine synthase